MTDHDGAGFVLHLTLDVSSHERAGDVSRHFLRLMHGVFPEVVVGFASISPEDAQNRRSYLFCGRRIKNDLRCMQRPGHDDEHSPKWSR